MFIAAIIRQLAIGSSMRRLFQFNNNFEIYGISQNVSKRDPYSWSHKAT